MLTCSCYPECGFEFFRSMPIWDPGSNPHQMRSKTVKCHWWFCPVSLSLSTYISHTHVLLSFIDVLRDETGKLRGKHRKMNSNKRNFIQAPFGYRRNYSLFGLCVLTFFVSRDGNAFINDDIVYTAGRHPKANQRELIEFASHLPTPIRSFTVESMQCFDENHTCAFWRAYSNECRCTKSTGT